MRRTKIVCTLGPASEDGEILGLMLRAGMDVARFNFSHGTKEEHLKMINTLRKVSLQTGKKAAVMLDTKGPELRVGKFSGGKVMLGEGQLVTLVKGTFSESGSVIPVNYTGLSKKLRMEDTVLLDDGLISLRVEQIREKTVHCTVIDAGVLLDHKSVTIPGVDLGMPALTEEDREDILFGIRNGIDFVAASFIKNAADILDIRAFLEENNGTDVQIIAKIESRTGVNNIDAILQVADGIMVARGDLGVEMAPEEVPLVQKELINKCNSAGKPVITATHMLDSMVRNPRPTRAEASDVANAILDGSDAIMLSGETAVGKYPVESVSTMARMAQRTEEALPYRDLLAMKRVGPYRTITDAISHASCTIAMDLKVNAVLTPTVSGSTARMVSKYRPEAPIIALSSKKSTLYQLSVVWGVTPVEVPPLEGTDEMFRVGIDTCLEKGLIHHGDLVVLTAGVPIGVPGTTNLIKVQIVGDVLVRGTPVGRLIAGGKARVALLPEEAQEKMETGDVLVAPATDKDYMPALRKASAVVVEEGGLSSHAAITGLNLGIPVIVGAHGAVKKIIDGELITVDGTTGTVYKGITRRP